MLSFIKSKSSKILGATAIMLSLFGFMMFTNVASAASLTTDQINAVITLLKSFNVDNATINNVQASLTGTTNTNNVVTPAQPTQTTPTYKLWSKGEDVKNYQNTLVKNGFLSGGADGVFGPKTKDAITKFQKKFGLAITGFIDSVTGSHLKEVEKGDNQNNQGDNNQNSDCTSTSPSSIKVLSPNGGEVFTAGQQVTVKWSSCNVQNVYLSSAVGGHDMGLLSEKPIVASQGSYQWTIPSSSVVSQYGNTGYSIGIESQSPSIFVKSNSFTINSGTTDDNLVKQAGCGVSFSKTSAWSVISNTNNETVLDMPSTGHTTGTSGIDIKCVLGSSITDTDAKFGDITYYYDSNIQKWMVNMTNERDGGTLPAVVATPEFTVNGFQVFHGTGRWLTYIIPISPSSILSLREGDTEGGYTQTLTNLVKTIKKL